MVRISIPQKAKGGGGELCIEQTAKTKERKVDLIIGLCCVCIQLLSKSAHIFPSLLSSVEEGTAKQSCQCPFLGRASVPLFSV